jgi:hypothetical protein
VPEVKKKNYAKELGQYSTYLNGLYKLIFSFLPLLLAEELTAFGLLLTIVVLLFLLIAMECKIILCYIKGKGFSTHYHMHISNAKRKIYKRYIKFMLRKKPKRYSLFIDFL